MRAVHFVGTIPDPNPVARVLIEVGERARWVPVPEPTDWIVDELETRATLPALRTLKRLRYRGNPRYHPLTHSPIYLPKRGQPFPLREINTGYVERATKAAAKLSSLTIDTTYPPPLQLGIPSPTDLAWCSWGPLMGRYYHFEQESLLREIDEIHDQLAGAVTFQLEIPLETCMVAQAPRRAQATMAAKMAQRVYRFIGAAPAGSRWILHLCLGDPHGRPVVHTSALAPLVVLSNALVDAWPPGTWATLEGLHLPIPENHSAFTDPIFYRELAHLDLPVSTALLAGVARVGPYADVEAIKAEHQRSALECIEAAVGRSVVVSSPCGWGRRPTEVAALFERLRELADA